jgi:hypothetical protein
MPAKVVPVAPATPAKVVPVIPKTSSAASVTSPKPVHDRTGMPVAIPIPPTPKPAIKTPYKPIVAAKPVNLVNTPSGKSSFTPVVAGLVDPFLASLQRPTKGDRPTTPSIGSDSADSTPERISPPPPKEKLIIDVSLLGENSPPSPTASLSSSWTLIEKTKKDVSTGREFPSAPPSTPTAPARRTWFGTNPSSTASASATPAATPILAYSKPIAPPAAVRNDPSTAVGIPSSSKPLTQVTPPTSQPSAPQGRKLFTFELKVGQSIVSTPVHEMDDPRTIAEDFARQHDLETRLPGGKATVDRIVYYFESQYVERRREREKRRAERKEKMKGVLMG